MANEQQIKPATDSGKIPTPTFPTEPPKEVKEMTFSIDPKILGASETDSTVKIDGKEIKTEVAEVKKVEEAKKGESILKEPKDEKKEQVKSEEIKKDDGVAKKESEKSKEAPKSGIDSVLKPPASETKKEEVKKEEKPKIEPITPVKPEGGHDAFDYSGFSEQEKINLKNMSRQSREYTSNLIKENKSLAALKDANYLQHEHGYTLSPEFQELQQRNYLASVESECWKRALLAIKGGKEFQNIIGFDKQGNPTFDKPHTATDEDEIRITENLSACTRAVQEYNGQLQTYPTRFKQQIQSDLQAVEQTRKERFAWVADPKLLEYSINVEGTDKKLKEIKSDFKGMLPVYWQNNPIAEVASDLFVAMIIQGAELKEAKNGRQVAEIKKQEAARGEPSSDNVDQPKKTEVNGKSVPSTFSLEGAPFEFRR